MFAAMLVATAVKLGRSEVIPAAGAPWAVAIALGTNGGNGSQDAGEYLDRYRERFVRSFLDWVVLSILVRKRSYGYELIAMISDEYNLYLSSGTLYPVLYNLERMHLVTGAWDSPDRRSKKIYEITSDGLRSYREGLETISRLLASTRLDVEAAGPTSSERVRAHMEAAEQGR